MFASCRGFVLLSTLLVLQINNSIYTLASPLQQQQIHEYASTLIDKYSDVPHSVVVRQADEEKPKTPAEPEKPAKDKDVIPGFPAPLELEPDAEAVPTNNTSPSLPGIPEFPGFPPGPLGPPSLYPPSPYFPGFYGQPQPPILPPPEFGLCDIPPDDDPAAPEESKKLTKQAKLLAKMQCDFLAMQQKMSQFYKNIEGELTELKKLNYNTVARLARLESLLRTASPFGAPF